MRFGLRLVAQLSEAFTAIHSRSGQQAATAKKRGLGEKNGLSTARAFQMAAMALGLKHVDANSICASIGLTREYASTREILLALVHAWCLCLELCFVLHLFRCNACQPNLSIACDSYSMSRLLYRSNRLRQTYHVRRMSHPLPGIARASS